MNSYHVDYPPSDLCKKFQTLSEDNHTVRTITADLYSHSHRMTNKTLLTSFNKLLGLLLIFNPVLHGARPPLELVGFFKFIGFAGGCFV